MYLFLHTTNLDCVTCDNVRSHLQRDDSGEGLVCRILNAKDDELCFRGIIDNRLDSAVAIVSRMPASTRNVSTFQTQFPPVELQKVVIRAHASKVFHIVTVATVGGSV